MPVAKRFRSCQAFTAAGRVPVQSRGTGAHAELRTHIAEAALVKLEGTSKRAAACLLAAQLLVSPLLQPGPSHAVLNSPNAQIARSPEAALRRATPAFNADVKTVQRKIEDIQTLMRIPQRKPWGGMAKDLQAAQVLVLQLSHLGSVACVSIASFHQRTVRAMSWSATGKPGRRSCAILSTRGL